ncbi:MAG TPA: hypothetical protein VJ970_07810, partial [Flavobacteriaceae bacterium]|nr:hypothetical protein [Flavobacteriaceae bacterium]
MKKNYLLITCLLIAFTVKAQFNENAPWVQQYAKNQSAKPNSKVKYSIPVLNKMFNAYWEGKNENKKGSGYKPYRRWEDFWKHYTDENGYTPTSEDLWQAYETHLANMENANDLSNWESYGPKTLINSKTSTANLGRVNVIVPDPKNMNIIFAGTPAGGLWKSTDKGMSWIPMTDELPQIGVSAIAIDPFNSNIIYIATGDDDAADTQSAGVFKSFDAGVTWNQTGVNPSNTPYLMSNIYIHPNNSNILWLSTSSGLLKSTDAGNSWTLKQSGNIIDLKLKPGDPNVIYCVTNDDFYKSTDAGENFTKITSNLPTSSGRFVIDVTEANPEVVYLLSAKTQQEEYVYQGLYKSVDSGDTFTKTANTVDILESNQAWFDLALAVSDTNENELYTGCLNIWKSTSGGASFTKLNSWSVHDEAFTHADIHYLEFFNNELFAGTDGGFYLSEDRGTTFQDYTQGMQIGQFYRISVAPKNSDKIAGGLQDNGGFGLTNSGDWSNYHGGDGMDNAIDPNNQNKYYGFTQRGGTLNISVDAGETRIARYGGPEEGNWITPLEINNEGLLYAGYKAVYTFDGNSFQKISNDFNSLIDVLALDHLEPNYSFVGVNNQFYFSSDNGQTYTNSYSFNSNINSIEVHNSNSNILYVTTSG